MRAAVSEMERFCRGHSLPLSLRLRIWPKFRPRKRMEIGVSFSVG